MSAADGLTMAAGFRTHILIDPRFGSSRIFDIADAWILTHILIDPRFGSSRSYGFVAAWFRTHIC